MQMLTLDSEEGDAAGMGLIPAHTRRFAAGAGLRVPHMGWDAVRWLDTSQPLTREFSGECRYYFVHSFKVVCDSPQYSLATCTYGTEFSAAIVRGNISGYSFTPRKATVSACSSSEFRGNHELVASPHDSVSAGRGGELLKTRRFRNPLYLGDPINAVKLFNDLECDEFVVVDIRATLEAREPDYTMIEEFASEAFMPLTYGGGDHLNRADQAHIVDRYSKRS